MGLSNVLLKLLGLKDENANRTNSFGEDLTRLDADGELPWGWAYAHRDFTDRILSEYKYFLEAWIASRGSGVLKEYAALKSFVIYMNDAKMLCESNGECFIKWFYDIIADQEYIEKRASELQYIEENIDELLQQENARKKLKQP